MPHKDNFHGEFSHDRTEQLKDDPRIEVEEVEEGEFGIEQGTYHVTFKIKENPHGIGFTEYQAKAETTAVYPSTGGLAGVPAGVHYTSHGLSGEAGEVQEKIKKAMREDPDDYLPQLLDEMGDVLWYWTMLCYELDLDADEVAQRNLEKLSDRWERDQITGEGDDR